MRLTKFGHSGVRIESGRTALAVDPGVFTQAEVVEGVQAVLVTHEHPDHWSPEHLRAAQAPIFTIEAVARAIGAAAPDLAERITVVTPQQHFRAADIEVQAVGEWHAVIHEDLPQVHNSGYLLTVEGCRIFHPGDALVGPEGPVDLLLAPICAPWMRMSEGIDFARATGAPRVVAIHEKIYAEAGLGLADRQFAALLNPGQEYLRLADGADLA